MKGIIFLVAQQCCESQHGPQAWDEILADAGLDGAFSALGNYDDEDLLKIVSAAAKKLGLTNQELIAWLGESASPVFAERYPYFYKNQEKTIPFLLTLNSIIHPEVRKLYPGADAPDFEFDLISDNELLMTYNSKRKLCKFAEGLVRGTATHYGEGVDVSHLKCMIHGDDVCTMRIRTHPM